MAETDEEQGGQGRERTHVDAPPFVVGLGASAGGIKALKEFFTHVAPDSGAAYVVILHLSPDHDSQLAGVLQVAAPIPVTQVAQRVAIEPDHVYVIPPNKSLVIADGELVLEEVTRVDQRRSPVDVFFRALADAHGPRAVCVVLSGTGPNGSAGLKRVKEHGGLAIAQDPAEADYGDMPTNAIATGLVDVVLPVARMPGRIAGYHQRLLQDQAFEAGEARAPDDPEALREIVTLMRMRTGHDFSNYKAATLRRQVARRVRLRNLPTLSEYARMMRETPDEAAALMKEMLISVTSFFRDPADFAALAERVIPRLFAAKGPQAPVRVWVPACATGEEAYSVAMLLAECADTVDWEAPIQVFATDLDERAVAAAREGFYSDAEVADVSEARLARFFHRAPGGYRVRRDLREGILFAHHNLLRDPPFSHLDLISCRNLLIYLNRSIQERVVETFHFALNPGGYLFLGVSEAPDGRGDLFSRSEKHASVFQSRAVAVRPLPLGDAMPAVARSWRGMAGPQVPDRLLPAELHQELLERYAPPSLVVSPDHTIVHLSARAGRYLQVAAGEPSRDLLALARPELRQGLRSALKRAVTDGAVVEIRDVPVSIDNAERRVTLRVRPGPPDLATGASYLLVLFDERDATPEEAADVVRIDSLAGAGTGELDEELRRTRRELRAVVEQYETQVEEAKAANEELQASNEELRSAAEELETSKEELQSVNEELTTVNQELNIKIEELRLANNDFQNLMNSTDIGTIFLDRELRLKMFTPSAGEIFNCIRTDIGRPLAHITSHLRDDGLIGDARAVLERLQTVEREVQTTDGRWHSLRVRPYRTGDDRIDGVVITFLEITDRRRAEDHLRASEERLRLLIDSVMDYALLTVSPAGRIDSWNAGAERMFGYPAGDIIGQPLAVLFTAEDQEAGRPAEELERARRNGRAADERPRVRRNGSIFYCSTVTTPIGESDTLGFVMVARDLSGPRQAAEALTTLRAEVNSLVAARTGALEAEVSQHADAQRRVASILRKIVTAQEDERARIARDLHDHLGQQLTALRMTLERHRDQLGAASPGDDVDRALALTQRIDAELDFLAWELRPAVLDDFGLAAALPRFVRDWSEHHGVAVEYRSSGYAAGHLPLDAEVVLYRVTQEALNNVGKHAHASRVDVMLEIRDGTVVLLIEDDGVGFEPGRVGQLPGIGLLGMQERAGLIGATLQVESAPGKGTAVFLRCPIAPKTTGDA